MAGSGDLKAHEDTYNFVTWLFKVGTIICFVIAAFVVWLIA